MQISTGFASWQRYCTASSSGRQPNFGALNRGHHLYSTGRPSRWAYVYLRNFVSIGLFCCPMAAENHNFCRFWTSGFSGVASWPQSDKVEHGYTTTNLPLSNGMKIVSVIQRLHGEIRRAISDVQKRDEQKNRQTDKQKTKRFWLPRRRVKSEPHQTWHDDRGPRACSCTSKTLWSDAQFRR